MNYANHDKVELTCSIFMIFSQIIFFLIYLFIYLFFLTYTKMSKNPSVKYY